MRKNFSGKGFPGAVLVTVLTALLMLLLAGFLLSDGLDSTDSPFAAGMILFFVFVYLAIAVGATAALVQRWQEIQGGEEDEAKKY